MYGLLCLCGRLQGCDGANADICIIRKFQQQQNTDGTPLLTEFECPVLVLTNDLYVFNASETYSLVSIVHICSSSCTFSSDLLHFTHNFSNSLFCLNIFNVK